MLFQVNRQTDGRTDGRTDMTNLTVAFRSGIVRSRTKATELVIAFPRQTWLSERASLLHYKYSPVFIICIFVQ